MLKIGVLVSGGGTNLQAIIDSIDSGYIMDSKIVTVISSKKESYALERAKIHNIDSTAIIKKEFDSQLEYEKALVSHFNFFKTDLILMAGFNQILSEHYFINSYKNKIMNIHPSLIPSFCGKGFYGIKVHEEAISKGVRITGATVHFVDYGTDTGPIILQKAVDVLDNDTPELLQKRVMEQAERVIYPEAVKLFAEDRLEIIENIVKIRRSR